MPPGQGVEDPALTDQCGSRRIRGGVAGRPRLREQQVGLRGAAPLDGQIAEDGVTERACGEAFDLGCERDRLRQISGPDQGVDGADQALLSNASVCAEAARLDQGVRDGGPGPDRGPVDGVAVEFIGEFGVGKRATRQRDGRGADCRRRRRVLRARAGRAVGSGRGRGRRRPG